MKNKFILAVLALLISTLACNLPGGSVTPTATQIGPDAAFTLAAQTVEAELTRVALSQPATQTVIPGAATATLPPIVSNTSTPIPLVSPTNTQIPCNLASFVQDVTIPDGSNIVTNSTFTKTWRLKNVGSCTWTSSYSLVFDRGDKMSGPDAQPISGSVAPGQTVDISVSLTAPASAGSYRGYWRLRDGAGVLFGLATGSFWVDIKAVAPTLTPTATTSGGLGPIPVTLIPPIITLMPLPFLVEAPIVAGESGSVRTGGGVLSAENIGDTPDNLGSQGFLSFDISAIPAGATINEVKIDFSNYDMLGNPFALGCMRLYPQNYGTLDGGDYFGGSALGALVRWCNASELSTVAADDDLKSAVQAAVGSSRIQFRVQFNETVTNNNNVADMVRLGTGIKLIISYSP